MPDFQSVTKKEVEKKKLQTKPQGIALPIEEMSFDWMNDDDAMGAFDTDDENEVVTIKEAKEKIENPPKPKGIDLPIAEMTFDWMDDDTAMGSIETDDEDDVTNNKPKFNLDFGSTPNKEDDVPEIFSPVHYWKDPIPEILDLEEPMKNAEKSRKAQKARKELNKAPKAKKEKSWLANNMAGMFDRKLKLKPKEVKQSPKTEKISPKTVTVEKKQIPMEDSWLDKWKVDDAETKFYEQKTNEKKESVILQKNVSLSTEKTKVEVKPKHNYRQVRKQCNEKVEAGTRIPAKMDSSKLRKKINFVETDNEKMR